MKVSNRKVNEWFARAFGYFWLPCPLCGDMFGGHEWEPIDGKSATIYNDPENPGKGRGICPTCTVAGKGNEPYSTAITDPVRHAREQFDTAVVEFEAELRRYDATRPAQDACLHDDG